MRYTKTTPCKLCPFRNDEGRLYVPPDRLAEMVAGEFCCHETGVVREDEEESSISPTERSLHCAGALIFLEKQDAPHQMMRICECLGLYDHTKLDMNAPVFGSMEEVEEAEESDFARSRGATR